jgi:hypothetical protein
MSWELWIFGVIVVGLLFWIGFLLLGISDTIDGIDMMIDEKINPPHHYEGEDQE